MYSYEERIKAVELYIKYDLSAADTVRKLGYPDRKMLVHWYQEYKETGKLHGRYECLETSGWAVSCYEKGIVISKTN